MRIPGLTMLKHVGQDLRNRVVRKAVILLYHRVAEPSTDPQLLAVAPPRFAQHMEILSRRYRPMGLPKLVESLRAGMIPEGAVAVTFDDGYRDNLLNAKPVLKRHGIPATVFITTRYVGEREEFWWDELDRLVLQPAILPEVLRLNIEGQPQEWNLGDAASCDEKEKEWHRHWNVLCSQDPTSRQRIYRLLCHLLRPLGDDDRNRVITELREWSGAQPRGREENCAMSPEEIHQLVDDGLVEVGAHTVTHPRLASLPVSEQSAEIRMSKARLEEICGYPLKAFAYPYGTRADYSKETVAAVRDAGFAYACANFPDVVWRASSPWELPRVVVRDLSGEEFERVMVQWLGH